MTYLFHETTITGANTSIRRLRCHAPLASLRPKIGGTGRCAVQPGGLAENSRWQAPAPPPEYVKILDFYPEGVTEHSVQPEVPGTRVFCTGRTHSCGFEFRLCGGRFRWWRSAEQRLCSETPFGVNDVSISRDHHNRCKHLNTATQVPCTFRQPDNRCKHLNTATQVPCTFRQPATKNRRDGTVCGSARRAGRK
jgi:hypothetical protein